MKFQVNFGSPLDVNYTEKNYLVASTKAFKRCTPRKCVWKHGNCLSLLIHAPIFAWRSRSGTSSCRDPTVVAQQTSPKHIYNRCNVILLFLNDWIGLISKLTGLGIPRYSQAIYWLLTGIPSDPKRSTIVLSSFPPEARYHENIESEIKKYGP